MEAVDDRQFLKYYKHIYGDDDPPHIRLVYCKICNTLLLKKHTIKHFMGRKHHKNREKFFIKELNETT